MTVAERLYLWNRWYDDLPQEWRFQIVLWPLIVLGACNMLLSLSVRFPFGLLVLIGVLCVAAVRVPYALGWITPATTSPSGEASTRRLEISGAGADWIVGLNQRYEAIPEERRFWVFPAILLIAGAINMQLTINNGYPFGLIFLIVLLAIIVVRAPYAHGLLRSASSGDMPAPALQYNARITDAHSPTSADAHPAEPATSITSAPPVQQREERTFDPSETTLPSVDMHPASQPGHQHDAAASLAPTVPPESELAPEPREAGTTHDTPAPSRSHPAEPSQTD